MFDSRYRRFSPGEARALGERGSEGLLLLPTHPGDAPLQLDAAELRLAQLHDGQRPAAAVLAGAAAALGRPVSAGELESFAAELASAGALQPGSHEPLPGPRLTEAAVAYRPPSVAQPPSTMPGSLAGPGLFEGLLGLITDPHARDRKPLAELPAAPFVLLGRPFNLPLWSTAGLWLLALMAAFAGFGLWQRHVELVSDFLRLLPRPTLLMALVIGTAVIHFGSQAARAAAIARTTGQAPRVWLRLTRFFIPVIDVDSGGAVQRIDRVGRTRVVAAGLVASLLLFVICAFLWFFTRGGASSVAPFSLGVGLMALVMFLLRLNPLIRRDGYFLLAQHLGIPDLREQVLTTLFGFPRSGWVAQQRALSPRALLLFAVLTLLNMLLLLALLIVPARLLSIHFGGVGFLFFLGYLGVLVSQTFRSGFSAGSNLGLGHLPKKPWWRPSRRGWIALAVFLLLCVLPYRYHPSGDFVVLPQARADVRALIAGDVREVLVKEGDLVKAGQAIARIADDEQLALIARSEARLAQLNADLSLVKKGNKLEEIEVAQSAVATATKRAQVSAALAGRLRDAAQKKSVTAQEYDRARGAADVDQKALEEARSRLALVKSPAVEDRVTALEAQVRQAEAELKYNQQLKAYTQVTAPIAGRVLSGSLMFARGSFLNRGDLLAVIEDSGERIAEVKLPETAIGEIKIGSPASTRAWAFPGSSFKGEVKALAPAAEEGPYGRVVRVQVSLADPDNRLLPGMTGNAKVSGDWHLAIVVFSRALTRFLLVEVWSWIP